MNASVPGINVAPQNRVINSISDLKGEPSYDEHIQDDNIKKILLIEKGIYVSRSGVVFTVDGKSEAFRKVSSMVKSSIPKWDYRIASEEVITHLKVVSGLIKQDVAESQEAEGDQEENSTAQQHLYSMISHALSEGASDVHLMIRPEGKPCAVLFRKYGRLQLQKKYNSLNKKLLTAMMKAAINYDAATKGGDSKKSFSFNAPNDAQVPIPIKNSESIRTRIGSMPSGNQSCKISLRLLSVNSSGSIGSLTDLGFTTEQAELIRQGTEYPFGAIFFTGPTGSGKSTAIASGLNLVSHDRSVITLEQPVENVIDRDNIVQCPIDELSPDINWTRMLRAALRNDPDVIMIGEVRDPEVAQTATRAASTGHLVLTTLHVNTALEVPSALEYYGLQPYQLAERTFIRLIVAQRLLPKLCTNCRKKLEHAAVSPTITRLKEYFKEKLSNIYIRNYEGCGSCIAGIKGRTLIAEVVKVDSRGRQFILERKSEDWRRYLKSKGWFDMKDHAEQRVLAGDLCPQEAEHDLLTPFGVDSIDDTFDYADFRKRLGE